MSCAEYRPQRPQQVTRVPPYRPGMWVRLKSGLIRKVKSLTASIRTSEQHAAVWLVHFEADDRHVEWHGVDRQATEDEILRTLQAGYLREAPGGH